MSTNYDHNTLPEFISEDLEPSQLFQLSCKLSNEVARLSKIVGGYEVAFKTAQRNYKNQLSEEIVLHREVKTATVLKAIAESEPYVKELAVILDQSEVLLIMAKAELDGRDKQYQGIKKLIDLKVQELRTFRG